MSKKNTLITRVLIFMLVVLLSGCLLITMHPKLSPKITFQNVAQGSNHQSILIVASDARESKVVGLRGPEDRSAPMLIEDDLGALLAENISIMAKHYGYDVSENAKSNKQLKAKLLVLRDDFGNDFFHCWFKNNVVIDITAVNGIKEYKHIYRYSDKTKCYTIHQEDRIQQDINNAFSQVLSIIANDHVLWSFIEQ